MALQAWRHHDGTIFACDLEPNGGAFCTLTMTGLQEGKLHLMEALMRRMSQAAAPPVLGAGDPAPFVGAWEHFGKRSGIRMVGNQPTCIHEFGAATRCEVDSPQAIKA